MHTEAREYIEEWRRGMANLTDSTPGVTHHPVSHRVPQFLPQFPPSWPPSKPCVCPKAAGTLYPEPLAGSSYRNLFLRSYILPKGS